MGRKLQRGRNPILLYSALCLIFLSGGCALLPDKSDKIFRTYMNRGNYKQAYATLEQSHKQQEDKRMFGYILLFADPQSPYFSKEKAIFTSDRLLEKYPESAFAVYAEKIKRLVERIICSEMLNAELSEKLEESADMLKNQNEIREYMETHEELNKKLIAENKELYRKNRLLNKENNEIKRQLEMMKEVDLNADDNIIR
ncbi:hypothetical protein Dacet_1623 [Denitrovibrio acetiphilus DSM 12809]|uniref:Uncharacterized protein n=1 Tax=Denitrovibrio acetiphilus (strain DSM 12809 / NBRC 114555 / N2460) TaxID=522772 RepID=D4H8P0_DENA2|nr:hypothetical protein [Denitrovibrio acetiphilus]ADD68389.1 hypothetical protein Dacet_1623 [Denitrovibrio acetiphilus DSM 12809]